MKEKLANLTSNSLDFNFDSGFYAILGVHVSTTARSPALWNARLEAIGWAERMFALDVQPDAISKVLDILFESEIYLGGAVAVPYKSVVAKYMGSYSDRIVQQCGATNCIYRNLDGRFSCTNTDGIAALQCLKEDFNITPDAKVMLLGFGGVGKAIAASLVNDGFSLVIATRTAVVEDEAKRFPRTRFVGWAEKSKFFVDCEVLINCTTLGSAPSFIGHSPLSEIEVGLLPKSLKVFDVVYNPELTALGKQVLAKGLTFRNGLRMNQKQAEIGMDLAFEGTLSLKGRHNRR